MASFEPPRGTRDFDPETMQQRRGLQKTLHRVFQRYGYQEISTPTFEHLELFTQKSGDEIVKQLYDFQDKSERDLTLRPELTASVIRFFNNELRARPKPLRVYYHGNCFRYERPQSGRYREFWQFGAELIGAPGAAADAEIIAIANECVTQAGADTRLRIGHIGLLGTLVDALPTSQETRDQVYRDIDKGDEDLPETLRDTDAPKPLADAILSLAQGGDIPLDLTQEAPRVKDAFHEILYGFTGFTQAPPHISEDLQDAGLGDEESTLQASILELEETLTHLAHHDIDEAYIDLGVARGLDYYAGVVFEIEAPELGAESQVAGGGRYELAQTLGGQPTPTTGFGLGFDRVLLAANEQDAPPPARVHITPIGDPAQGPAARLATTLRNEEIPTTLDLQQRSISKNLAYADKQGIPAVILLGSDEIDADTATLKDMETGDQEEIPQKDLVDHLRRETPR